MPEEIRILSFLSIISSDNYNCIIARYSKVFQGIKQTISYFDIIIGIKKEVFIVSRTYIAIDLKSFYASVECRERGLDALTTHLVAVQIRPYAWQYPRPSRPMVYQADRASLRSSVRSVN